MMARRSKSVLEGFRKSPGIDLPPESNMNDLDLDDHLKSDTL